MGTVRAAPFSRLSTTLQSSYSPEEESEEDDELWTGNVTKVEVEISSDSDEVVEKDSSATSVTPAKKGGILENLKSYIAPPDDGLTFRQRLAKLGLAAALSYGWVSNMSYSVSVSLAWYIFSKRVSICCDYCPKYARYSLECHLIFALSILVPCLSRECLNGSLSGILPFLLAAISNSFLSLDLLIAYNSLQSHASTP